MKITYEKWNKLCKEVDEEVKADNGHQYVHMLKTRCQLCGRSSKQKGRCPGWLNSFMDKMYFKIEKLIKQDAEIN
jgi:hypothetical protein